MVDTLGRAVCRRSVAGIRSSNSAESMFVRVLCWLCAMYVVCYVYCVLCMLCVMYIVCYICCVLCILCVMYVVCYVCRVPCEELICCSQKQLSG
jgi:hypothetical protein